eukprot:353336-Chlamydomonas_euryale.AAC.5
MHVNGGKRAHRSSYASTCKQACKAGRGEARAGGNVCASQRVPGPRPYSSALRNAPRHCQGLWLKVVCPEWRTPTYQRKQTSHRGMCA